MIEEELRLSQDRLRLATRTTGSVIWEWIPGTNATWWSESVHPTFRYDHGSVEPTIEWWYSHMHPADRERVWTGVRAALEAGETEWAAEYRFRRGDGAYVPVHDTAGIIRDDKGQAIRMIGVMREVPERDDAMEALRESENRFRLIAENVRDILWISDPRSGRLLYVNPAFEETCGRSRESIYADPGSFLAAVGPEARERVGRATRDLPDGEWSELEFPITRPDGEQRWLRARRRAVRDEEGNVHRVVGIAQDVTVQRETHEKQRFLLEAGKILSSSLTLDETLRHLARLAVTEMADWCAIYLREGDDIRTAEVAHRDPARLEFAKQLQRRYPPDPNAPAGAYRVMQTGEPELLTEIPDHLLEAAARDAEHLRLLRELGLRSAMTVPLRARGKVVGAISFVSESPSRRYDRDDVSLATDLADRAALAVDNARLFAEAHARAESERALRTLAESVAAASDAKEVMSHITLGLRRLAGAAGALVERVVSEHEVEIMAAAGLGRALAGERIPFPGSLTEEIIKRREPVALASLKGLGAAMAPYLTRHCADCSVLLVPVFGATQLLGAIVLLRLPHDPPFETGTVEQVRAVGDLAALALQRLAALAESEQRRGVAEAAVRSRDEVLAIVAHDLRNPVNTIGMSAALLADPEIQLPPAQRDKQLEIIARSSKRLNRLIQDLLDVSQIEAGRLTIRCRCEDPAAIAHEACDSFQAIASEKSIRLACHAGGEFRRVFADRDRIIQVLANYLNNAMKFTPAGGEILVSAVPLAQGGVRFSVADTGPGIPAEHLPHLFARFWQARETRHLGSGLGLAIANGIAEAHRGRAWAESRTGKGSIFHLELPPSKECP